MIMQLSRKPCWGRGLSGSLIIAVVMAGAVSGCAGAPSSSDPSAGSAGATTSDASSAHPEATSPVATPALAVRVLPESVLTPIPGVTYSKIKGAVEIPPEFAEKAAFWEGAITRRIARGSAVAGTVQLFRIRPGVVKGEAGSRKVLKLFLSEFAQTKSFEQVAIDGRRVLTADNVRGTGGTVAGWYQGRDFVVIYAVRGLSARKIASSYLGAG